MEIDKILIQIGISSNKLGFYYIKECINLLKNENMKMYKIYETIALKSNTNKTPSSIERAIRYVISYSFKVSPVLKKIYNRIPNNSEFLYDLLNIPNIFIDTINEEEN